MAKPPTRPEERTHTLDAKLVPMGYQQITGLSTVKGLNPPQHARVALIQGLSQNVRWRDDGTVPSATVGMQLLATRDFLYTGDLVQIKFIEEAASAEINVSYYY